ncbi:MAG: ABC transporter ATP-binding protein [Candidatus Nanopelagicales bacterium]
MTADPGATGLAVEATVTRGGFTLGVRFHAAPGEVLGVLGPNGSGKSTLLRALAGLVPLRAGRVSLDGQILDDADLTGAFVDPADRPIGYVFQDYRLFPHLSVVDNVAFAARARGGGRAAARREARAWLERLDLTALADRRPATLSGGQAQRVALVRALAREPGLLLLDEPLAALDARTRLDVREELGRHLAGFPGACLLVTHDPVEALVLADRLLVIEGGVIVQEGTPAEVTRRPATEYVAKLVGLNLYAGRARDGRVDLDGGGSLLVAEHPNPGAVLVAARPSAVVVSTRAPQGGSARNTWPATVTSLSMRTERVRLTIDGTPPIIADVTPAAVAELGLGPGVPVWVSVKATELVVYEHTVR